MLDKRLDTMEDGKILKEGNMKGKWRIYVIAVLVTCAGIAAGYYGRALVMDRSSYVVKDPMVIYSDYSIERFQSGSIYGKGVYGVISEAKLKKLIGVDDFEEWGK